MKQLFLKSSIKSSKVFTNTYSTSFSLGIRMLDRSLHEPIYSIYGFVRVADEIVDTFHKQDKEREIHRFREHTMEAIQNGFSSNPILHSFQWVVNQYDLEIVHIEAFFKSMIMDLSKKTFNREEYEEYIYGSAEVVGLMCLKVFCHPDNQKYQSLIEPAKKLGSAFQKVNFLRDLNSDYYEKGRMYFPAVTINSFDKKAKKEIENELQKEFDQALVGIEKLPGNCRFGVYTAFLYYLELFKKLRKADPDTIKQKRIRVSNLKKYSLLISSFFRQRVKT